MIPRIHSNLSPVWGWDPGLLFTPGLRPGLHSYAAPRLKPKAQFIHSFYARRYRCYPLLSGDLDLLWLQLFLLRKDDLQDAIFVVGANLLVVHRCRDGKRAAESAVGALDPMVVFLFSLLVEPALAFKRQNVLFQVQRNVLALHSGELGLHDNFTFGFKDIHRRTPRSC